MGEVATACSDAGGRVYGVITERLSELEVAFEGCDDLVVVETMRERKRLMVEEGDAFRFRADSGPTRSSSRRSSVASSTNTTSRSAS